MSEPTTMASWVRSAVPAPWMNTAGRISGQRSNANAVGLVSSAPRIPPDDALVPALGEEVRTPPVAGSRKPAVSFAHDHAVGSIHDTHPIAAALRDEVDRVAFVFVARDECG